MSAGLTSRERMLRVLKGEKPDVVPAAPAYLGLFLADFVRGYYVEQYRRRTRGLVRYPIDHQEDTLFRARALYQAYGVFKVRPDWISVYRGVSRAFAARTDILVQDGVLYYEDKESDLRLPMARTPLPYGDARLASARASVQDLWDLSDQLQSKEQVDARLPILSAEALLARGDFDLPRQMVADYGEHCFIATVLDPPYSDAYDLLGFKGLMLIQYDRPALFHHLLARKLAQSQEVVRAWAATGIHGVYAEETFTGADIISQRSYDEFVFAYNQPYFCHMRDLGLLAIHYVCGDVIPRLERITQLGVAAVAVEESKKNFVIDIQEVVERVAGRAAVWGNIDAVRYGLHATLDEMAAEVRRQAAIGARANGFVVSTGSPFPLDTNPRLIDTLVETAHALAP